MTPEPHAYIKKHLLSTKSLPVSEVWLSELLSTQRPGITPLPALAQTALFRLLASDFTRSLEIPVSNARHVLPTDISNPSIKERRISGPVPVQILDIEDIGSSVWSQVEALERIERGESIRGREVIRTVPHAVQVEEANSPINTPGQSARQLAPSASSGQEHIKLGGPHRLILQDCRGTKVVAIELKLLGAIKLRETAIGTKLLITNAIVARGMALLNPECVAVLGGKIEGLDRQWKAGRKTRLLSALNPPETTS
ncbi:hypothetical protein H106_02121 [Trichophyton rubrum CBS 735.88]|nr:hypothetical protein H106_02121 [Trichophyton rubrum CBS 735.88]